jgi:PAS domain S-box-containing protein
LKARNSKKQKTFVTEREFSPDGETVPVDVLEAENILSELASVFFAADSDGKPPSVGNEKDFPSVTETYRILVEQIPAVVFIAFFDKGFGEAYVSPQIEKTLGFTQAEWLNDPVRWYQQIHSEDKERWSVEAAQIFLTGEPLNSVYRVLARDGSVISFQCDVKMVRRADGRPWFIHGVGFDVSSRESGEKVLREYAERMKILSRRLIEVQESERRNIALELHDEIGQILTGLKLTLEMSARLPEGELRASLAAAQALVNELMARTRKLSLDLRPATLDHLGLHSALLRHLRHYTSQTQIEVDFLHDGLEGKRFAPELETAAFRIVQEALTNIARHADAEEATVSIWADENRLTVEIEDDGKGFEAEAAFAVHQSSGLAGMRERALLLGGNFTVESTLGGGSRLIADWHFSDDVDSRAEID